LFTYDPNTICIGRRHLKSSLRVKGTRIRSAFVTVSTALAAENKTRKCWNDTQHALRPGPCHLLCRDRQKDPLAYVRRRLGGSPSECGPLNSWTRHQALALRKLARRLSAPTNCLPFLSCFSLGRFFIGFSALDFAE